MTIADDDSIEQALNAVTQTQQHIIQQLRRMAAGDFQYQSLLFVSPEIKNIWNAAADIIETNYKHQLH